MKKILTLCGSNSSKSINKQFAKIATDLVEEHETTQIDLTDYPLPIYSQDIEENEGLPENAVKLKELISEYDAYIIVTPEHNSSLPAFFKNTLDWISRVEMKFLEGKPFALLSTSPGPGGGQNAASHAELILTGYLTGKLVGKVSLPNFYKNVETVDDKQVLIDETKKQDVENLIKQLEAAI